MREIKNRGRIFLLVIMIMIINLSIWLFIIKYDNSPKLEIGQIWKYTDVNSDNLLFKPNIYYNKIIDIGMFGDSIYFISYNNDSILYFGTDSVEFLGEPIYLCQPKSYFLESSKKLSK